MLFQFQSGTIKGQIVRQFFAANHYFNSNLVRLKVSKTTWIYKEFFEFQFQSGTIKGARKVEATLRLRIFQFQSGTIKGYLSGKAVHFGVDFNSNLVRLKGALDLCRTQSLFYFNSNLVRLKVSQYYPF